jgi:ergothioneine biosynthesis protein EgtB
MLTDLKHLLLQHPRPFFYRGAETLEPCADPGFESFSADLHEIGAQGESFSFDNEGPRHRVYVEGFRIARSLVSNREYLAFVESGAYREPAHWLSEAWHLLQSKREQHPAYWRCHHGTWQEFTFAGWIDLEPNSPVRHLNFFEAQAFATWAGKRLPTEFEWEVAARSERPPLRQLYNQVWQWTSSAYAAYPGFRPLPGAVSEYNGKFMVNQYVLRGGSIATPPGHIRPSYRNFFYPTASWQFSGLRLAESI